MITSRKVLILVSGIIVIIILSTIVSQLMKRYQEKIDMGIVIGGIEVADTRLEIIDQTEDGRYLLVGLVTGGTERRDVVYDTESQSIMEDSSLFTKDEETYTTEEKDNVLSIFKGNELIYSVDLLVNGFEKISTETSIHPVWSSTNRYVFITQFVPDQLYNNLLIDLTSQTILTMPVESIIEIKWSSDDKKAIFMYVTETNVPEYRWSSKTAFMDFEKGDFKNIQFYGDWVPNSYYVFTESMERYDMENGFKREFINVTRGIHRETIRWISPDEVVFITTGSGDDFRFTDLISIVGAFSKFIKPYHQYSTKLDFHKKTLKEKKIDSNLTTDFFWSRDYNDLYFTNNAYSDKRGLYKMQVKFGK